MSENSLKLTVDFTSDKVGMVGAVTLSAAEFASAASTPQLDPLGVPLFIFSLVSGVLFFMWFNFRWPKNRGPTSIFAGSTLAAIAVLVVSNVLAEPSTYYMKVIVFQDANGNGQKDGTDAGIPNVEIKLRNVWGQVSTFATDANGNAMLVAPNTQRISIGVCGVSQDHLGQGFTPDQNKAATIFVGIARPHLTSCQPQQS